MLDLTVIILTKNEALHLRRVLTNVAPIAKRMVVVDSGSTDSTVDIARECGAEVVENAWPGNQASQFNWAIDNLNITTEWILRLDADEYLTPELIDELKAKLHILPSDVSSISLKRARCFAGKRIRHGIVNSVNLIRIFRRGTARYENRLMDEHLKILSGRTVEMRSKFVDDNLMPISDFIIKHIGYANREAATMLDAKYGLSDSSEINDAVLGDKVEDKRRQKQRYAKMPMFWRAWAYFIYRYIFRLGFLDGTEGFLWDFMQGYWYRVLVDANIREILKASGGDREQMKKIIAERGIKLK